MKIIVDLLFIIPGKNRGTQTYVDSLLAELSRLDGVEVVCLTNSINHEYYVSLGFFCHRTMIKGKNRFLRIIYQQLLSSVVARRLSGDVLFCPGYLSPIMPLVPTIPVVHDMNYRDIPGSVSFPVRFAYSCIAPIAMRTAACVVAVSDFSKGRIVDLLGLEQKHVVVVHEGPLTSVDSCRDENWVTVKDQYSITSDFFLSVSSGLPHKNLKRLIEGFLLMKQNTASDVHLVLIGHALSAEMLALLADAGDGHGVVATGFVSEETKLLFFKHSLGYFFPSVYEGFGLPVLEAQICGIPLASSTSASLPEVAGEGALYFDPLSVESIASAFQELYEDSELRCHLVEKGYSNVARFSWMRAAEELHQVFCSTIAHPEG
jgi:glycosyltransferase involved in cell wall biosynthesis